MNDKKSNHKDTKTQSHEDIKEMIMFKPVQNPPDFPAMDHALLERWERERVLERSIEQREGAPMYVFYDGPPGTNGVPHIGHLMQSALKDLWPRFETMRGKQVLRKAGWDTHGLPVELTADRELGLQNKKDIEKFGVEQYTNYCRSTVFRYKSSWEEAILRIGRFLDMKNYYATFKTSYIQSDWWILKQAWETRVGDEFVNLGNLLGGDRFLYKDYRISAWCPQQGTTLSNFEVAQGYEEITELALYPKFRVVDEENLFLVAWTTTAWTLLSNLAIAVGPEVLYVRIRLTEDCKGAKKGEKLIVARTRLKDLEPFIGTYEIEGSYRGSELAGRHYHPLWSWQREKIAAGAHFVIADNYVTADDGTGIVHLAPYGEDDFRLIKEYNLLPTLMVNERGYIEDGAGEFSGRWFKDDDLELDILKDLAAQGLLLGKEKHEHTYPFHYKTGSPLIYFPRPGWFIRTTAMREEMLEANRLINWYPARIRDGRFGKWLENIIDWNITRERYWGSPLPIWSSEDGTEAVAVGSIADLNEHLIRSGYKPLPPDADLHKPGIDKIVLINKAGDKKLYRENYVLDSWYNAGIMPWGQFGYPAEPGSIEYVEKQYPADFICEGLDQTRGWFYSMLACSVLVALARGEKDKRKWSSYKNVICTDLVLDADGEKMSKSRGNVIAPIPVMEKFGADAVRWSFYKNNPWSPIRFGEEPLLESLRGVFIPLWNAYSFFVTYANVDGWLPGNQNEVGEPTAMDRWILTCYNDLINETTRSMEAYDVMPASVAIADFVDRLTNWYIRRSRRRFWKSEELPDKERAYRTLYSVLTGFIRLLAPFAPFISDEIYLNLEGQFKNPADSVHLQDWVQPDPTWQDDELKMSMDLVRRVVSLGHAARNDARLKVRQPLRSMKIVLKKDDQLRVNGLKELVVDELNVRALEFTEDSGEVISYRAKANFKVLGPRFGKDVSKWSEKIEQASEKQVKIWKEGGIVELEGEFFTADEVVLREIVDEQYVVKEEQDIIIALYTPLDDELLNEGYARELINKIQNRRKTINLEVTQRIGLQIECDERIREAIETHQELISREVLATRLEIDSLKHSEDCIRINDRLAWFQIEPV